jgi:diguanylate cyclase (GGDEF)-like protein
MGIEYNKELHIELLRDEIILTREELLRKFKTHNTFCDIVNEVHSTLQLDELKKVAQNTIENLLKLDTYALLVWDYREKRFIITESRNMGEHDEAEAIKKLENINKLAADEAESSDLVYLPLNEGKVILGALCIPAGDYPSAARGNGEVLRLAVNQLSKAIENSVMYEDAKKRSITDDKTRLFNFGYLRERLDVELKRSSRYGHKLAVMMVDIDDFKAVNTTYGHVKGDEVLMETAGVLTRTCRDIDIIARFGGDEFTIIMPENDIPGARTLADRIRDGVKRHRFDTGHGFDASISVSIGIAAYPDNAKSTSELVRLADQALLRAKETGKDRTDIAGGSISGEDA